MRIDKTSDPKVFDFVAEGEDGGRDDLVGSGWLAEITGTDPKWGFKRTFVAHARGDDVWYNLRVDVIYEYRNLYVGGSKYSYLKYGGASGFFRITPDGEWEELTKSEVMSLLRSQQKPSVAATSDKTSSSVSVTQERR